MGQHMLPEAALLTKGGSAQLTFERLVARVDALVVVQVGHVTETLRAVGTSVRALVAGM